VKRAERGSLEMQDTKNRKKSPSAHHNTTFILITVKQPKQHTVYRRFGFTLEAFIRT